jgi:hypothetical protein
MAGCRTGRSMLDPGPLPGRFPHHSVDEIRRALLTATDTLHSLRAVSSAAVASPDGSSQFTAVMNHRRGDSARVDVKVQFGIEAARILFTPDSFFVYDRIKKTVYYGDTESASRLLPMPWQAPDLFIDILGLPAVEITDSWSVEADSLRYYLTSMDGRRKLFVDPTIWRIVRTEARDSLGVLEEERAFLDFDLFSGVPLPRRIVVRRPVDRISATISHRSLTLNPETLHLDFDVSNNATYVRVY